MQRKLAACVITQLVPEDTFKKTHTPHFYHVVYQG